MNGASVLMLMGLLVGGTVVSSVPGMDLESVDAASSHYSYDLSSNTQSYADQSYLENVAGAERRSRQNS